jgi:glycosyltransferase involved in cell wall biosynthesis
MQNVSIIIPTYKRGEVVQRTLPSYMKQKHVKEIIIVDDGGFARPFIEDIINRNKKIRYFSPSRRLGLPGARNFGISKATSDFIVFGEDDVEFTPRYVEMLMHNLQKEDADIIAGRQIFVYAGETKSSAAAKAAALTEKDLYLVYPTDMNFSVDLGRNMKMHTLMPFALFRKSVFRHLRYDESISGNYHREETDLYVSALEKGFRIIFCNSAFVWHLNYLSEKGGCRTQMKLSLEISLLKNNIYFWKKHYKFLSSYLNLQGPLMYYALKYSVVRYLNYVKNIFS